MILKEPKKLFELPTTDRFAWKFRTDILDGHSPEQLNSFLFTKKRNVLDGYGVSADSQFTQNLLSALPAPEKMKDAFLAAARILKAIKNNEKITVFGDYDVDGTTSCAMLFDFFKQLNITIDIYIPDRLTEGYGLNPIGLQNCADKGTNVIITVDNGIASVDACILAKKLNIDVIITDHHDLPPILPDAFATLNPKQTDCNFGFPMLAGAGVTLYLMIAIRALLRKENSSFNINLKSFLDYVAIGTIADLAPLTGVNHILCKLGLEVLNENIVNNKRPGLYELLLLAGWEEPHSITSYDIGYKIGPRLNAAGRLGNALNSVTLLTTQNSEEAKSCAAFLHEENASRQILQKSMTQEALLMAEKAVLQYPHAIVLHKEDWHPGIVGLVASRVLERFYKPTIILGSNEAKLKGSGRSTHAFNLFQNLDAVRSELLSFGGHYHAIGISLESNKLKWLQSYLNSQAQNLIAESDTIPILNIDGALPIAELTEKFVDNLAQLEPFGQNNSEPQWLIGPAEIRNVYRMGQDKSQGHAKITLRDKSGAAKFTVFGSAEHFELFFESGTDVYAVVKLKRRTWKSKIYLDLLIVDFAAVMYLNQEKVQFNTTKQGTQNEYFA